MKLSEETYGSTIAELNRLNDVQKSLGGLSR